MVPESTATAGAGGANGQLEDPPLPAGELALSWLANDDEGGKASLLAGLFDMADVQEALKGAGEDGRRQLIAMFSGAMGGTPSAPETGNKSPGDNKPGGARS